MNRYDWLFWGLRLFVTSGGIEAAKQLIADAENLLVDKDVEAAGFSGVVKRDWVATRLLPYVKAGGIYLARGLIELLLAKEKGLGGK